MSRNVPLIIAKSMVETELYLYEGKWRLNKNATPETADIHFDMIVYNDSLKPHKRFYSELKGMDVYSNIKRILLPYPEPQPQFNKSIDMIIELMIWVESKADKKIMLNSDYCLFCKSKLGVFMFEIPWLGKKLTWHQGYKHYVKIHRCVPSIIFIEALGHFKKNKEKKIKENEKI